MEVNNLDTSGRHMRVNVRTLVDNSKIRREMHNGREHIVVPSYTLPDDVVMNGGLYPKSEIEKSYRSLEGTLAPLGHPQVNGEYVPAGAPEAINAYHAGAWNRNVQRKDNRVYLEKWVDIEAAQGSEQGRRLLDAINSGEAIHTSTGIFLQREPVSNAADHNWIAKNMQFDHDAILLDEPGAATPEQGVGMMVNSQELVMVVNTELPDLINIENLLMQLVNKILPMVSNRLDYQQVMKPNFEPVDEDLYMKEQIIAALKAASIETEGVTDEELLKLYAKMLTSKAENSATDKSSKEISDAVQKAVNAAVEPLKTQLQANADKDALAKREAVKAVHGELIANALAGEALDAMFAKCQTAAPLVGGFAANSEKDEFAGYMPGKEA